MFLRRAVVLGAGAVGREMARDLARRPNTTVTVVDVREEALAAARLATDGGIDTRLVDLSHGDSVAVLVEGFDVVLSALPPGLAGPSLRAVVASNRLIADAGTPVEDAARLDELAVEMEVAACVGCNPDGFKRLIASAGGKSRPGHAGAARLAALVATALARRLLTGDFRGHWGVWTPERLGQREGLAHGILQDLAERGVQSR